MLDDMLGWMLTWPHTPYRNTFPAAVIKNHVEYLTQNRKWWRLARAIQLHRLHKLAEKDLASILAAEDMGKRLLDEAMQTSPKAPPVPELDVYSLEPIFDLPARQQRLQKAEQDIRDQGLEYRDA